MFSLDTIKKYCEERELRVEIIPFKIGIDIPKKEDDVVRSYTIKTNDGNRMIINGLQLINNHYLFKIRK